MMMAFGLTRQDAGLFPKDWQNAATAAALTPRDELSPVTYL
jgi:hypothetical protein